MITMVKAVATSLRARRPRVAMVTAPATANTPSPTSSLAPMRLAPAAPAKAPLGRECAANADAPQHGEEPHHPGHHGHDGRRLPGRDHEGREHQRGPSAVDRRCRRPVRRDAAEVARYTTKTTRTMQKLAGHA